MSAFDDALDKLQGNSTLKSVKPKTKNIQKSMMINKEAIDAHRINQGGNFSAYVNELLRRDQIERGWINE